MAMMLMTTPLPLEIENDCRVFKVVCKNCIRSDIIEDFYWLIP